MASPATFGSAFNKPLSQALSELNAKRAPKELAYKVYVINQEQNMLIEAWLPEQVTTDVTAEYEAPYAQGLNQAFPSLGALARFLGVNLTTQALTAQVWQGGSFITIQLPLIFQAETSAALDVMDPIKKLYKLVMPSDPVGGGLLRAPGPRMDLKKLASNGLEAVSQTVSGGFSALTEPSVAQGDMKDTGSTVASTLNRWVDKGANVADNTAKTVSSAIVNSVVNNISLYIGQFLYFPSVVITDVSPAYDVILANDKNPIRATVNVNFKTFYIPTDRDLDSMFPAAQGLQSQGRGGK